MEGEISAPRIVFTSVEPLGYVDIENGIHGLILKNVDFETMIDMLKMIHYMNANFPPKARTQEKLPGFFIEFSKREKEIFAMVVQGKKTSEIANELTISSSDLQIAAFKNQKEDHCI